MPRGRRRLSCPCLLVFGASRGRVEAGLEAGPDSPVHARKCLVQVGAEADPKLYNIIKGVGKGLGLGPECARETSSEF